MARPRRPERDKSLDMWLKSGRKMMLKDIAEELGVSPSLIRKWKSTDKWDDVPVSKTKRGAPRGNKNAIGNKGGAPKGNKNAETHGMFSEWLPTDEELQSIYVAAVEGMQPHEILWEEIAIAFTNLIRAQKIMYVANIDDMTKVIKREKVGKDSKETEYDIQHAWDKQAKLLTSQAAASRALTNKIVKYEEMIRSLPAKEVRAEHRLRVRQMQANVKKTNAEIKKINEANEKAAPPTINIVDAWSGEDE